jgi:integral membrane protein
VTGADAAVGAPPPGFVSRFLEFRSLEGALLRYRVFAYIVGVGLFTLVFVGVPLQYGAGVPQLDAILGPIHGFFYIGYLLVALDLARRARFTLIEMLSMIGAGLLPILAFVIERRITRRVRTEVLPTWSLPLRR